MWGYLDLVFKDSKNNRLEFQRKLGLENIIYTSKWDNIGVEVDVRKELGIYNRFEQSRVKEQ